MVSFETPKKFFQFFLSFVPHTSRIVGCSIQNTIAAFSDFFKFCFVKIFFTFPRVLMFCNTSTCSPFCCLFLTGVNWFTFSSNCLSFNIKATCSSRSFFFFVSFNLLESLNVTPPVILCKCLDQTSDVKILVKSFNGFT